MKTVKYPLFMHKIDSLLLTNTHDNTEAKTGHDVETVEYPLFKHKIDSLLLTNTHDNTEANTGHDVKTVVCFCKLFGKSREFYFRETLHMRCCRKTIAPVVY